MTTEPAPVAPGLPRTTWWAHGYNIVNTLCWAMVTGVPMQLLLKDLHASATIIGILLALPSGTQLLQLWVAPLVDRLGYKRFAMFGWIWRTILVLLLAALALSREALMDAGVPALALVLAILVLLLVFNALRAVANTAFMPWYSVLIPDQLRGRFLARDNAAGAVAGILVSVLTWAIFAWNPPGVYALVFALAAFFGILAMGCIERVPDPKPTASRTEAGGGVPWKALLTRPYVAQLAYNLLWTLAMTGSGVCWVGVLRDVGQAPASMTALMPMVGAWTALALLPIVGSVVDHTGNRPTLGVATLLASIHLALWGLLAAGILPFGWPVLILIQTFAACGGALFALGAARLLMSIVPVELRAQGFAFHGVVCGVAGAVFPILWGLLFDLLVHQGMAKGMVYGTIYGLTAVLGFAGVVVVRFLPDPGAHRMRDFLRILAGDVIALIRRRRRPSTPVAQPG